MDGTEIARVSGGKYSTAFVLTAQLTGQEVANNKSNFHLRAYAYYGGSTKTSSSYSSGYVKIDGNQIYDGVYTLYPGYTYLGDTWVSVNHNSDGSFPGSTRTISVYNYHFPNGGSASGNLSSIGVPTIPRQANITSAPNFNDEQNPTISYSNPAGNSVSSLDACISFTGAKDDISYRAINKTGSSYTFNLTDAERKTLRSWANNVNSKNLMFYVRTKIGSSTYYSHPTKTFSIINATPEFNNFNYEDTNETTIALTGSNQKMILGYSNIKVTIPALDKATAKKEATMSKYQINCGNNSPVQIEYGTNDVYGTVISASNNTINTLAIDSRNNTKTVTKVIDSISYTPLNKGNITFIRNNGVSEETKLTLNGNADLVNFGAVTNSIKTSKYRYKVASSSDWSEYKNISLTIDNDGNFSFDNNIIGDTQTGFDINNSYNLEVLIEDELSSITYTANLNSGIPNIALHKDGVSIMGKYNEENGGALQIGGVPIIESGDGYIKYSNGLMICYGKWSGQVAITSSWGYISSSGVIKQNLKFAKSFKTIFNCVVSETKTSGYSAWICDVIYTTEQITSVQFLRGNSATQTFGFDYIAIGAWK